MNEMDIDAINDYGEDLAPDFAETMETMYEDYPNEASPEALVQYLVEVPWLGIFQLFLPEDQDNRDDNAVQYSKELITQIHEKMIMFTDKVSTKREAAKKSMYPPFNEDLKKFVEQFLKERGIEYIKATEEREKTINILKDRLRNFIQNDNIDPLLYYMKIDETEELKIQLKYTELGALIMWRTEIPHDLSALSDETLHKINTVIDKYTYNFQNRQNKNKNMYYLDPGMDEKLIKYTEKVASELCLEILNYNVIPRCVQKHNKMELQLGVREVGQGILPSIYNDATVILTSDANNKGNIEFSQVLQTNLYNITGKEVQFLNLDAGAAPTQIGFQESKREREQLEKLKDTPTIENINKPIDISVYSPTDIPMLHIKSNPSDLTQYIITIYSEDGTNTYQLEYPLSNLSISNVIKVVDSMSDEYKFNASILKSLGDLIPYQTVCLQTALLHDDKTLNVMGSIDYSMIFQLLGNVQYFKNGNDVTDKLNKCRILTGVNIENSNVYFPWSYSEKHVYQLLCYLYHFKAEDRPEIKQFFEIKNNVSTILHEYRHQHIEVRAMNVLNFLMNICIADLEDCKLLIKTYPDSELLIKTLENAIQPFTTIEDFNVENITKPVQSKINNDEPMVVDFDNLDYILAYMIARRNVLPTRTILNITPRVEKPKVVKSSKVTKKKIASPIKRRGGKKYKKTIKKRK